jgi:hypothetical protein
MGYVGLANLHRLTVSVIGGLGAPAPDNPDGPRQPQLLGQLRDLRGRRRLQDLSRFLLTLEPGGPSPFTEGCKRLAVTRRGKGVMLIISDFLIKDGYEDGLRVMLGQGYDVYAIQVLSPQEIEPTLGGDLRLKDCEDGDLAELTITAPLLKKYKATVQAYCNRFREFCQSRGITPLTVPSDTAVDVLVLEYLRRRGLLT